MTVLQISNQQAVDQTRYNGGEVAEEHASLQVVIQVRSYVRLHVLPSPALKAVVLAYESLLFDAQRPDIKYEIFVNCENCYISILLVSRRWRPRLSRGWRWNR